MELPELEPEDIAEIKAMIASNKWKERKGIYSDFYSFDCSCVGLSVNPYDADNELFASKYYEYPINTWLDLDESVGLYLMVFFDKPIGITWKSCRRCYKYYHFFSENDAESLREFILSIMYGMDWKKQLNIIDLDKI